jgi:molybdate transport system substrate-binding protein
LVVALTVASSPRTKSRYRLRAISLARALAVFIAFPALVSATEIKMLSAGALTQPLRELIPQYEQRTGDKVTIVYGNAGMIRGLLEKGEAADLVAVPSDAITDAQARGWVQAGTRTDLAAVGIGVAVKRGTTPPDISTPDALKHALLAAKAVAYSDPTRATSGKHFDSVVLPALGIADQVRAKAKLQTEGSAAEFVRRGEADIAVQQVSELLAVEGVTVVGLLPESLQKVTVYSAAVAAKASSRDAAQRLLAFLATPASKAVFKSKGMDAPL